MSAVHEQVHQRAGQQQKEWQCPKNMGTVFAQQKVHSDNAEDKQADGIPGAPERRRAMLFGMASRPRCMRRVVVHSMASKGLAACSRCPAALDRVAVGANAQIDHHCDVLVFQAVAVGAAGLAARHGLRGADGKPCTDTCSRFSMPNLPALTERTPAAHDHIARQQKADVRPGLQRTVGQWQIAGAKSRESRRTRAAMPWRAGCPRQRPQGLAGDC